MNTDLIKGNSGKTSLIRVISLIVVLSVMFVFILHNVVSVIKGGPFISLGTEESALIIGVLATKAAQRFGESKTVETAQDIPTNKVE